MSRVGLLAGGNDQTLKVWYEPVASKSPPQELNWNGRNLAGHEGGKKAVPLMPHEVTIEPGEAMALQRHARPVNAVAFEPPGAAGSNPEHPEDVLFSAGWDGVVVRWESPDRKTLFAPLPAGPVSGNARTRGFGSLAVGRRFVAGASLESIFLYDVTGAHRESLHSWRAHTPSVSALAFHPGGHILATGGLDREIRLWALDESGSFATAPSLGRDSVLHYWTILPDHEEMATADGGRTVKGSCHQQTVTCLAWTPDGKRLISGSRDKTIAVWDAVDGRLIHRTPMMHSGVNALAVSRDGKRLASAGQDNDIVLWEITAEGLDRRAVGHGHTASVTSVAFDPSGMRIISGSEDKTVKVWDAEPSEDGLMELLTLEEHTNLIHSVAFSPSGRDIASASSDGTVRVWKTE